MVKSMAKCFCVLLANWCFCGLVQLVGCHTEYPIHYPASNTVAVLWECQNGSVSMDKVRFKKCFFFQNGLDWLFTILSPQPTMSHLHVSIKALVAEWNQSHGGCYINTHDFGMKCCQSVMKSDMLGCAHNFGHVAGHILFKLVLIFGSWALNIQAHHVIKTTFTIFMLQPWPKQRCQMTKYYLNGEIRPSTHWVHSSGLFFKW